ncbi:MAG: class I SAM-dependent methyltransferase [Parvularcula sp.]|jgi:hypothetical protein|nr:class I SAM-dependent methyltransferase [Parvularcula sp.]
MELPTVNRFRIKRGEMLQKLIEQVSDSLERNIVILDIGGRPDYWDNVGFSRIAKIELVTNDEGEVKRNHPSGMPKGMMNFRIGDACDLSAYADQSVDLVHSNSVIEHVGNWEAMVAMANEVQRVGRSGWIQTPAWEFPLEPHFRLPFMHWFGRPIQTWMVYYSPPWRGRRNDLYVRRHRVERVNLLSKSETQALFPGKPVYVERTFLLPKSYTIYWSNYA